MRRFMMILVLMALAIPVLAQSPAQIYQMEVDRDGKMFYTVAVQDTFYFTKSAVSTTLKPAGVDQLNAKRLEIPFLSTDNPLVQNVTMRPNIFLLTNSAPFSYSMKYDDGDTSSFGAFGAWSVAHAPVDTFAGYPLGSTANIWTDPNPCQALIRGNITALVIYHNDGADTLRMWAGYDIPGQ